MADQSTGNLYSGMTHGGAPNIRADRLPNDTWQLATLTGSEISATIKYRVPADEVCFYFANFGIGHPDCPDRWFLSEASAKQTSCTEAELTETYKQIAPGEGGFQNPDDPPPNTYSLRSSEFSNPIQLNERFWATKPAAPVESPTGSGNYVCMEPGTVSEWARGFVYDRREGRKPNGMAYWTDGNERNAFPACHPKFGIESYLESGAEWVCVEYDINRPTQANIDGVSKLHTIDTPPGLVGAAAGKWLYTSYNYEFDGQWHNRVRSWRYNRTGWDPDIYNP